MRGRAAVAAALALGMVAVVPAAGDGTGTPRAARAGLNGSPIIADVAVRPSPPVSVAADRFDCPASRRVPDATRVALAATVGRPDLPAAALTAWSDPDRLVLQALENVDRYALTTLYGHADLTRVDPLMSAQDPRGGGAEALALAATIATGSYDPSTVGVPLPRAAAVTAWLVASYACAHAAVTPGGWGAGERAVPSDPHQWPSPLWAAQLGTAGWLMWPRLGIRDHYAVAAMVANEADRLTGVPPAYYAGRDGQILHPGDTKSEEDAWLGTVLSLASAMMPTHPHAALWRREEAAFEVAAYATAADVTSPAVVNGRPLASWVNGWNAHPDGTVTNHNLTPHPDYMATLSMNLANAAVDVIGDRATLRTAVHNAALVYRALSDIDFPAPPYADPGGAIYRLDATAIYYPRPNDWGTAPTADFVALDAGIRALGLNGSADHYLAVHTRGLLGMQARHPDGATYSSSAEFTYPQPEQWVAEQVAHAWLLCWAAAQHRIRFTDEPLP